MKSLSAAAAVLIAAGALAQTATTGVEQPSQAPQLNAATVQGCFSSSGDLVFNSTPEFNTIGLCASQICIGLGKAVGATTGGNQCWCGDEYPPTNTLVDDSFCNVGCAGFDKQACGGINYWTVYNTGLNLSVPNASPTSSAGAGASGTGSSSGSTVVVTTTSTATAGSGSSSNTAGIAAGVVVGVIVITAVVAGVFFFMRRRRNAEIEEEHRRNATVNAFISGQKPPSSSGGFSVSDSRLDPVMAQRRMSSGSIADDQDYSRRILRVTNA